MSRSWDKSAGTGPATPATTPAAVVVDVAGAGGAGPRPVRYVAPPKPSGGLRLCGSGRTPNSSSNRAAASHSFTAIVSINSAQCEHTSEFVTCHTCHYRYWIDVKEEYKPEEKCCGKPARIWKFRGMVARDTVAIFCILQAIIVAYACVVERIDSCDSAQGCGQGCSCDAVAEADLYDHYRCPEGVQDVCGTGAYLPPPLNRTVIFGGQLLNHFSILHVNRHYKTTYYFAGMLFFFATIGVLVCCHSCCYFQGGGKGGVDGYTNDCVDNYTCYYCCNDCPCCWSRHNSLGCCCYGHNYRPARYQPALTRAGHMSGPNDSTCCQGSCNSSPNCGGGCNDCKGVAEEVTELPSFL